jgi:ribosomal protein S12 methylthiotransferase accessory factor
MEAVELACAERVHVPIRVGRTQDLRSDGRNPVPLLELLSAGADPGEEPSLRWIEGYDLISGAEIWVPFEAVSIVRPPNTVRYWQSTDGLASGNDRSEAIFHGLCERIERDAVAIWKLRSDTFVSARCFDGHCLQDEALGQVLASVARAGLEVRLFDITTDLDVPVCFATISRHWDGRPEDWLYFDLASGSGCHPDMARAAMRAVTEAAQTRVTTIAASRDDFDPSRYQARLSPDLLVYVKAIPKVLSKMRRVYPADLAGRIAAVLDRLEAAKAGPVYVVPLTAPETDFSVVKVLAVGLENPGGLRLTPHGARATRAAGEGL